MVQGLVLVLGSARLLDEGTRGRGGQVQVNKEEQAQQCNEMNWLSQLSSSIRGMNILAFRPAHRGPRR